MFSIIGDVHQFIGHCLIPLAPCTQTHTQNKRCYTNPHNAWMDNKDIWNRGKIHFCCRWILVKCRLNWILKFGGWLVQILKIYLSWIVVMANLTSTSCFFKLNHWLLTIWNKIKDWYYVNHDLIYFKSLSPHFMMIMPLGYIMVYW